MNNVVVSLFGWIHRPSSLCCQGSSGSGSAAPRERRRPECSMNAVYSVSVDGFRWLYEKEIRWCLSVSHRLLLSSPLWRVICRWCCCSWIEAPIRMLRTGYALMDLSALIRFLLFQHSSVCFGVSWSLIVSLILSLIGWVHCNNCAHRLCYEGSSGGGSAAPG